MNLSIDSIVTNLHEPLRLEKLSQVAGFSPFHFHRIFQGLMGETLGQFVKRLRLEKALSLMSHSPNRSLTDIALACGFPSSSDFSRSFKQRYNVPPSRFDLAAWREKNRAHLEATVTAHDASLHLKRLPPGENPDHFEVTLRELPARRVAYIRVLDPYQGTGVVDGCQRLMDWAEERGVADGQWLGYMWDNPEVVPVEDCRYDIAVVIDDAHVEPDGEVTVGEFSPMQVAQIEVRGGIDLEMRALDWFYSTWLPTSGYVPDDQPSFEAFIGRPFAHGYEYFELYAQLPVRREG